MSTSRQITVVCAVLLAGIVSAQTGAPPPAFEVVSIKVHAEGSREGAYHTADTLTIGNYSLKGLICEAYHLMGYQVAGANGWMNSVNYDIVGKAPGQASFAQLEGMLPAALADRFQLQFHWDSKELPTYWLVVGKNAPKLRKTPDEDTTRGSLLYHRHSIVGHRMKIAQLLFYLGAELQRPILDKTGLEGDYDFKLEWADDPPADGGTLPDVEKPSLLAAVQEQLGLKLEAHPGPVKVLIIDHAAKPSEN